MSFAGVSLIRDGRLRPSGSAINDTGAASGYHLLVVEGYSCIKHILKGSPIESRSFRVGGYLWSLKYYPNGSPWASPGDVSAALVLAQDDALENSKHLKDDGFTLRCDVVVVVEDVVNARGTGAAPPFVTVPPPDMQRHFTDLLAAQEGTDVKFKVGGQTIAAHRCVLAARSRVFKAELFGPMKESTATARAIHIEDTEPRVFKAMLAFIYSDSEPELEKEDGEDAMWQWPQLLIAVDRYNLQRLKLMCESKICGFIGVNTTTTILELAENHHCDGLRKACYNFLGAPGNLRAVAATDGFDDLITSHPSVMKELIAMLAP
ncbi:BTB/POZ and MATH domain-containing protein 2-like [Triticum aestivum]|uniref:BTB/POZ and MATH domain-containing protein 2-like n=1 Tax=Triticum aestivum TaxID=4565 RepID=UPI001D001AB7|nr:BTB/POZ and MATH domain-containing protein 2-like [Triticum aestivum]